MKRFVAFIPMFIATTVFSQWSTMAIPLSGRYDDVFFSSNTTGWAVNGEGDIYKTVNGTMWTLDHSTGKYLRSVEFATPMLGFAGSLDSALYRTTDGGVTWADISTLITPRPPGICGLEAPTPTTIYGCGIWSSPAYVIKSEDGGDSWETIDLSMYASALVEAHFINADTGFVSGMANPVDDGGIILYTEDGGDTWTVKHKTLHPDDYIWKLQTPDGIHFYGSVEALPAAGNVRIVRSNDGGQTWSTNVIFDTYSYIQTIGFVNPQRGWTGGNEVIFETYDGGDTWEPFFFNGSTYNRIFRVNDTLAYMTGEKVYKFNGAAEAGVAEQHFDEIHTLDVSPNPADDEVTIHLSINSKTHCQLRIYTADGKLVQTFMDELAANTKRDFQLSIADIPAQSLYLVLKTNEGLIYRTIIKQ